MKGLKNKRNLFYISDLSNLFRIDKLLLKLHSGLMPVESPRHSGPLWSGRINTDTFEALNGIRIRPKSVILKPETIGPV